MTGPASSNAPSACGRWQPTSSVASRRSLEASALAVLVLGAALTWAAAPLSAQGVTGAAAGGQVLGTDSTPVEQAIVHVVNASNGERWETTTNARGRFFIEHLSVGGPYRIEVRAVGYVAAQRERIHLALGQRLTADFSSGGGRGGTRADHRRRGRCSIRRRPHRSRPDHLRQPHRPASSGRVSPGRSPLEAGRQPLPAGRSRLQYELGLEIRSPRTHALLKGRSLCSARMLSVLAARALSVVSTAIRASAASRVSVSASLRVIFSSAFLSCSARPKQPVRPSDTRCAVPLHVRLQLEPRQEALGDDRSGSGVPVDRKLGCHFKQAFRDRVNRGDGDFPIELQHFLLPTERGERTPSG